MKTKNFLIASTLVLALLLLGGFAFQTTAPKPLTVNMSFKPDVIDLGAPGWSVKTVLVTLWFGPGKYDGRDIDPKTVLIEGVLGPKGGWKRTWTERDWELKEWVFRFNVSCGGLKDLIWSKIHMGGIVGPSATIPLTVTGNLLATLDSLPFTGTGFVTVLIPTVQDPNPPPT